MERKNYLVEDLSNEEKAYLKRIIMTARNKYFEKNSYYLNKKDSLIDGTVIVADNSIIDEVIEKCQEEIKSAIEFEKIFANPKLYEIVRQLGIKEKEVLFYLYKEQKSIKEIANIMAIDRKTVERIRNRAHQRIARNLIMGGQKENV